MNQETPITANHVALTESPAVSISFSSLALYQFIVRTPPPSKKKSIQKPPWSPTGAIRNLFLVNISPHSFTVTRCSNCKMAFPTHFLVDLCPVPTPFPHPIGAPIARYCAHPCSIQQKLPECKFPFLLFQAISGFYQC